MKELLTYLLGVAVCGGVFTAFYVLALHRRVSFRTARMFLIASVVLSAAIPAFDIPVWKSAPVEIAALPADVSLYRDFETAGAESEKHGPIDYARAVALAAYIMGAAGLLIAITLQFVEIGRIRRRAQISRADGYRIAMSDDVGPPFSFLRTIYVESGTLPGELRQILLHESSHIRHRHSAEKIVMETLKALMWFNPFAWIASRLLNEVHEFEADRDVLQGGCTIDEYLPLIFRQVFGYVPEISTGLGDSLTKKRFEMMITNFKHRRYSWLRTAGVLPVAAGMLMLFGFTHRAPEIIVTATEAIEELASAPDEQQSVERPRFQGNTNIRSFIDWLQKEIVPPKDTSGKPIEGTVELRFTVMADGSLDSIKVVSSTDKLLSDEAVRALKKSPEWMPGTVNGEPVSTTFIFPVNFSGEGKSGSRTTSGKSVIEEKVDAIGAKGSADKQAIRSERVESPAKSNAGKPGQREIIEEKVDAAADEIISAGQSAARRDQPGAGSEKNEVAGAITVRYDRAYTDAPRDTVRKIILKNGVQKGPTPFIWLENEKREIDLPDDLNPDQVESISVIEAPTECPQEILDAMGDREFNGVIVIKSKQ